MVQSRTARNQLLHSFTGQDHPRGPSQALHSLLGVPASKLGLLLLSERRQKLTQPVTPQAALSSEARPPLRESPIPRLLAQLLSLVASESSSASEPLGPCLEYLLKNDVLATLVQLSSAPNQADWVRGEVVAWYGDAVSQLEESFLIHGAVSKPL